MSNENTNTKPQGKTPSHIAYQVRDREGQKAIFTRVGAAWAKSLSQNPVGGYNISSHLSV